MATPYDFSQFAKLGSEKDAIQRQIELATALGNKPAHRSSTWGGQLAGSLGDILRTVGGNVREGRLAEALAANRTGEQQALGGFNTELMRPDATPEERERLALGAISSGHPALAATGTAALQSGDRRLARALDAERIRESAETRRIENERLANESQRTAEFRQDQLGLDRARLNQESWKEVPTEQGLFEINKRTGEARPILGPGKVPLKPPPSPQSKDKEEARFEHDVHAAGKDLEELGDIVGDVNYLGKLAGQEGDIPGVGAWDARKPAMFRSDEDAAVRQRIDRLLGLQVKKTTGATATPQEMERIAGAYGLGKSGESQSKLGLKKLVEDTQKEFKTRQARFRPEVIEEFKRRGGITASDVGGKAPERKTVNGKTYEKVNDQWEEVS